MAVLTEQISLRLSEQQRDYLERRAEALSASCPVTMTPTDVVRLLIDLAVLEELRAANKQKLVPA